MNTPPESSRSVAVRPTATRRRRERRQWASMDYVQPRMVRQVVSGWFAEHGVDVDVLLEQRGRDRAAHAAGGAEDRDLLQTGVAVR